MDENITRAFKEVVEDVLKAFREVLESDVGINTKVGTNTLAESRLKSEAAIKSHIPFIYLDVNDYIQYIESGRRPKARKVPIDALREWARRKSIPSDNNTLYAIQQAIYRDGIKGRNITTAFYDVLDRKWDEEIADKLFQAITISLDNYFNE